MKYSEIQIEAIRIFGSKELSFGCIVKMFDNRGFMTFLDFANLFGKTDVLSFYSIETKKAEEGFEEILGHEPHLEDVFRVAKEKKKRITIEYYTQGPHLIINPIEFNLRNHERIEYNPTIKLLEQSEETLKKLISLFK